MHIENCPFDSDLHEIKYEMISRLDYDTIMGIGNPKMSETRWYTVAGNVSSTDKERVMYSVSVIGEDFPRVENIYKWGEVK